MKAKKRILLVSGLVVLLVLGGGLSLTSCSKKTDSQKAEVSGESETQLWTCGMHPEVIMDKPGNCPKCGMKLVPVKSASAAEANPPDSQQMARKKGRKILYWQAPMDPTEIYDHPGKSKMGMDLVPVYEDQAGIGSGSTVKIDPVTVQSMGIRTAVVQRGDFSRRIRTVGRVDYNEEKLYTISPKISGWIEKLYVDYTGKMVKKGDPLLEIYSPDLVTTQEEYLLALNNKKMVSQSSFNSIREGAESLLKSSRQRLLYWDIPATEIDRLEKTGEVRKTLRLDSPADGVVTHKNAVEGLFVKEGTNIYQIADLSKVWVYASLYDYEIPWIREGQTAEMDLSYLPGETFTGRVSYVYPYLDEKARDVRVRLEFPNPDLELKPGMYANVTLQGKTIKDALLVPSEAILRSGKRDVVFVVRDKGKFEPREIRIAEEGGANNASVRVLSGLLEGEEVVTSAQFLLDSESRLQEAIQKMLEEKKNKAGQNMQSGQSMNMTMDKQTEMKTDEKMEMKSDEQKDMQMNMQDEHQHDDQSMQHQH
jgi:multidrug efflux pump subunit AcrA (membrane-fusion protein)